MVLGVKFAPPTSFLRPVQVLHAAQLRPRPATLNSGIARTAPTFNPGALRSRPRPVINPGKRLQAPTPELIEATLAEAVVWHVIHSKPQKEFVIADQLAERGVQHFVPVRQPDRWMRDPRPRPVFSRYVFAAPQREAHRSVLFSMIGEHSVVAAAGELLTVPGKVMVELFNRVESSGFMRLPGLRVGDEVTIRRDPFAGLIGELTQIGGREVKVWVAALSATIRLPLQAIELAPRRAARA